MNNRDPFDLRRNSPAFNLIHSSTATAGHRAVQFSRQTIAAGQRVAEAGKSIFDETAGTQLSTMAYASSQNGPTHRHTDMWQSSGQSRFSGPSHQHGGVGEAISGMFGERKADLPMYKDKPFAYPGGRKRVPWYRQKRIVGSIVFGLLFFSWWFGIFSSSTPPASGDKPATKKPKGKSWFGSGAVDWNERAERVKDVFKASFADYEKHGWGSDEYHPVSKSHKVMTPKGMGWIIVDALDTMMLMNLTEELSHARQWIDKELNYDQDHDVNTFETTIRMLGGFLSAHYLSTEFPGIYAPVKDDISDDLYLEKATDLADRLLGAYETPSGVPLASINLHTMKGIPSHADGGASSTAEATTLQLEMKYLAKLTGEDDFWDHAEAVMKVIDDNNAPDGLVPIFIYATNGEYRGNNIRLGSRGDSYYEYLIKQYLQTSKQEPVYQAMWNESMAGIKKHLLTYSYPSNFTVLAERPSGLAHDLSPKMDHLVCFLPGTIALATTEGLPLEQARKSPTWGPKQDEDMALAAELMKTCWGMYSVTPTGLAAEISYFNIHEPPLMYNDFAPNNLPRSPKGMEPQPSNLPGADIRPVGHDDYIIHPGDAHNLQRPETVESLFYMWRITGDEIYRKWGWKMFEAFMKHTAVDDGNAYSSIADVMNLAPPARDNMESFWLVSTV